MPDSVLAALTVVSIVLWFFLVSWINLKWGTGLGRSQGALMWLVALVGGLVAFHFTHAHTRSLNHSLRLRRAKALPVGVSGTQNTEGITIDIKLQGYEVLDRVGIGGMGGVYRAKRKSDGQIVALKIPHDRYHADAKFMKRFAREADLLSRFRHPNIIAVYDYSMRGPEYYIAMEFVDGESLEHYLEERQLTIPQNVQILRVLADALSHIHAHKVVHRDIKPANVMLTRGAFNELGQLKEGGVKLMDFGIAVGTVLTRLTSQGARVGTPVYMAPEQAKGNRVDQRSDVYSLGLVCYEMLTGQVAFKGSYESVVHQQIFEIPKPPKEIRMEIPSKLNDLIMDMIAKDPTERPTLDDVIRRIDAGVLSDEPFDDPLALAVCLQERVGMVRLLDLNAKLRLSVRDLGRHETGLPSMPTAMASDSDGNLYMSVLDGRSEQSDGIIRKINSMGVQVLEFGEYGLDAGELLQPISIACYDKYIYILDAESFMVSIFDHLGRFRKRFGGHGKGRAKFERPTSIVVSPTSEIYVLDMGAQEVKRFDKSGEYQSRYAFRTEREGNTLRPLEGIGIDTTGKLYIVDGMGKKMRTISADGNSSNTFNFEGKVGEQVDAPWLIQVAFDGRIFAVRRGGQTLYIYSGVGDLLYSRDMHAPVYGLSLVRRRSM